MQACLLSMSFKNNVNAVGCYLLRTIVCRTGNYGYQRLYILLLGLTCSNHNLIYSSVERTKLLEGSGSEMLLLSTFHHKEKNVDTFLFADRETYQWRI